MASESIAHEAELRAHSGSRNNCELAGLLRIVVSKLTYSVKNLLRIFLFISPKKCDAWEALDDLSPDFSSPFLAWGDFLPGDELAGKPVKPVKPVIPVIRVSLG